MCNVHTVLAALMKKQLSAILTFVKLSNKGFQTSLRQIHVLWLNRMSEHRYVTYNKHVCCNIQNVGSKLKGIGKGGAKPTKIFFPFVNVYVSCMSTFVIRKGGGG